ncbi:hypothetical protein [Streptomyces oceani]|uniref:DUF4241 domain-containing protein n=1 Tax=Streptomyces oceani TaxID=1075402 RepID=A0A1E7KQ29_9ACTN|nr:hypothetical protein [Streptomyces oceani]OEV06045.1 hypothetical protein AN216_00815 [Streptomyces oceani]
MGTGMDSFVTEFVRKAWDDLGLEGYTGPPPDRLDRVDDLVVVGGRVSWVTPENDADGGFCHRPPDGTYPVYAAGHLDGEPERYCVDTLFIPLASPDRLTTARWDDGYDQSSQYLKNYACLWSEQADRASLPHWGDEQHEAILRAKEKLLAEESRTSRDNWTNEVVDPETGANILSFPTYDYGVFIDGLEALGEDGELLAILLFTI